MPGLRTRARALVESIASAFVAVAVAGCEVARARRRAARPAGVR